MANYTINFSDTTKTPITVVDETKNTDTSVSLIGRNYPGYGKFIAENFLHLLENFAASNSPNNPVEGQIWYDSSDTSTNALKVFDGSVWYPANGIHRQSTPPTNVKIGDIWIDTVGQQLYILNTSGSWILVGPTFNATSRTGPYPASIIDTDNVSHDVILMYINDEVIEIIAKETFRPISVIQGFTTLVPGVNLSTKLFDSITPRYAGPASSALAIKVGNETITGDSFLRKDIDQTVNGAITFNNNILRLGQTTSTFIIQKDNLEHILLNDDSGGRTLFRFNNGGVRSTLLVFDGFTKCVGINTVNPTSTLDVSGTGKFSGSLTISSTASSSLTIFGGASIAGNTNISNNLTVVGRSTLTSATSIQNILTLGNTSGSGAILIPASTGTYDIGISTSSFSFRNIYAQNFYGNFIGQITKLYNTTTFAITGQIKTTSNIQFDGQTGGLSKIFTTVLDKSAITSQTAISTVTSLDSLLVYNTTTDSLYKITQSDLFSNLTVNASTSTLNLQDSFIVYTTSSNTLKQITKNNLVADITPSLILTGTIIAYGTSTVASGYLLCDGQAVSTSTYSVLYNVIGTYYGTGGANTFRVPDLTSVTTTTNSLPIFYMIKT